MLWHGTDDVFSPVSHTHWLAKQITGCTFRERPVQPIRYGGDPAEHPELDHRHRWRGAPEAADRRYLSSLGAAGLDVRRPSEWLWVDDAQQPGSSS